MTDNTWLVLVDNQRLWTPDWQEVKSLPGYYASCKWSGVFVLFEGEYEGKRGLVLAATHDEKYHDDCVSQYKRLFGAVHKIMGGGGLAVGMRPHEEGILTFNILGASRGHGKADKELARRIILRQFPTAVVEIDADLLRRCL
ncbi:MAG: hypothetical protein PHP25_05200 [Candidatus Moranbacteria bacterium]|nr:hypothetical protein [Candidatus Moranbacteria bacterium]